MTGAKVRPTTTTWSGLSSKGLEESISSTRAACAGTTPPADGPGVS